MRDVASFLKGHPPFDEFDAATVARLAQRARHERFPAGTTIFEQGAEPPGALRMVYEGAVELVDRGRVVDLLGEGELFGHPSMVATMPTGLEARAHEDSACLALPAEDVLPLLALPAGLRYLARSLLGRPRAGTVPAAEVGGFDLAHQPVTSLIREQPIICEPDVSLRRAAAGMARTGASSVLVRLERGRFGIVTDRDLRSRVVAKGVSVDAPVSQVMSAPAVTIDAAGNGADVLMTMLDHGIRHLPVVTARAEVLGVVSDLDLLAAEARTPFALRRAIAAAENTDHLRDAARRVEPAIVALHEAGLAPAQISGLISVVADALVRRAIELVEARSGASTAEFAWLALGSHARREAVPSSDVDSGLVWADATDGGAAEALAREALETLAATGVRSDSHGLTATGSLVANAAGDWQRNIRTWLDEPTENNAVMALSIVLDHRTVHGPADAFGALAPLRAVGLRPHVLRLLLRLAVSLRPPTGFLRDFVIEHSGEHRGTLDIKKGGVLPVVAIARYAGHAAGAEATATPERLRAAADAGVLSATEARTLEEAHAIFAALRMDHQVTQLRAGIQADDHVDPKSLGPLARHHLRDAFRAVASVQRNLDRELHWSA
ncbi:MAG TPA: putative nucleotidyltransferase substrate binding domain-containing protein [Microbacterium sp.]|nr:putative nucleotidyltransferase substrate binding domain-containing protein [Microbacterium sp.]